MTRSLPTAADRGAPGRAAVPSLPAPRLGDYRPAFVHKSDTDFKPHYPEIRTNPVISRQHFTTRSGTPRPISDHLWSEIEPLIPLRVRTEGKAFRRRPGAGRKPLPARMAFEAIVHVLRTGTPWKSLPKAYGSASAIHRRFDAWHAAGLFLKIWQAGLAEHEEMEGISWEWHRKGGSSFSGPATSNITSAGVHPRKQDPSRTAILPQRAWQPSRVRRRQRRAQNDE